MADQAQRRTLDEIEQQISRHRVLYLQATWRGSDGEAEWHEAIVDQLLQDWDDVRRGKVRS